MNNTEVWADFQTRPDDIFVVTPPKCGTTWTQIIVTSLIAGRPLSPKEMDERSRWPDFGGEGRKEELAIVLALQDRRCIKSHAPLDGIIYDPCCTYFGVYRHPIDVHFSMRVHGAKMKSDHLRNRYPEDIHEAFAMFLRDELYDGAPDAMDLHSLVYHYLSFRKWQHLENIHLYHYADMVADLPGTVQRMARDIGVDADEALIAAIVEGSSFANLKAKAAEAYDPNQFYLSPGFFNSGTSGKWVGKLSEAELAAFDARLAVLLPDERARDWLLWGSRGGQGL